MVIKSYKQLSKNAPLVISFFIFFCLIVSCSKDEKTELRERYEDELKSANDKVAVDSSNAQAWFERGNVYSQDSEYLSAIASYDKALRLQPNYIDALLGRGDALLGLNQFNEALICYDTIVKIVPQCVLAWVKRGKIYYDLKQYELAISSYDTALYYQPQGSMIWHYRCDACNELADITEDDTSYKVHLQNEALRSIKHQMELDSLEHLADDWVYKGDSLALEALRSEKWKGDSSQSSIQYDEALIAYNLALSVEPNLPSALIGKSEIFILRNKYEDALACYDKVIADYDSKPWIYFMYSNYFWLYLSNALEGRANLYVKLNRKEDAINDLRRALIITPSDKSNDYSKSRIEKSLKQIMQKP